MRRRLQPALAALAFAGVLAVPQYAIAADTGGGTGTLGAGNSTTGLGGGTTGTGAPAGRPTAPVPDTAGMPGIHQGGGNAGANDGTTRDTRIPPDDRSHGGPHGAE